MYAQLNKLEVIWKSVICQYMSDLFIWYQVFGWPPSPFIIVYMCLSKLFCLWYCSLTDISGIQYRVLNRKKGPAVWVRLLTSWYHIINNQSRCWWRFQNCDIRNQLNLTLDYIVVKARCKFSRAENLELRTVRCTYTTSWWHVSKYLCCLWWSSLSLSSHFQQLWHCNMMKCTFL